MIDVFLMSKHIVVEKITKNEKLDGYFVSIPFELKDDFKSNFPSARWDSSTRKWKVGNRSGKRLSQWVELADKAYGEYYDKKTEQEALIEQADIGKKEIDSLNNTIYFLESKLENIDELKKSIENNKIIKEIVSEKLSALNITEEEAEKLEKELILKNEVEMNKIFNVTKLQQILSRIRSLLRYGMNINKQSKNTLLELQYELKIHYLDKLEELGLTHKYIEEHYNANVNRPDRDLAWIEKQDGDVALFSFLKMNED